MATTGRSIDVTHSRPSKTPASTGRRASIDVSGIAGGLGALNPSGGPTGGIASGSNGGIGSASGFKDFSLAPVSDAPTDNTGMNIKTPDASMPQALPQYSTSPQGFTPYHASAWQNLLSKGQAGMQANQLNAQMAMQQLADQHSLERGMMIQQLVNSGQMNVESLRGQQMLDLSRAQGEQQRMTQSQASDLGVLAGRGITSAGLQDYNSHINQINTANLAQTGQNQLAMAQHMGGTIQSPEGQRGLAASDISTLRGPQYGLAASSNIKLNPGERAAIPNPFTGGYGDMTGSMGTSQQTSRDPNNPFSITTQNTFSPGFGNAPQQPIQAIKAPDQGVGMINQGMGNVLQQTPSSISGMGNSPTAPMINNGQQQMGTMASPFISGGYSPGVYPGDRPQQSIPNPNLNLQPDNSVANILQYLMQMRQGTQ